MSGIEIVPSAKRLIKSLRDMGYDFAQAVADVIDNSIEAGATQVDITVEFDGDDSWLLVVDNGHGMRPEQLREALRYGAERDYGDEDLGKFGLGLKTASMSQCQRLSVATRWNPARADIAAYSWDLEHIERVNRWEILPVTSSRANAQLFEPLRSHCGTAVLWQRLDRILGYQHPYGESARKRLSQMCRDIEAHLGMVFHGFMTKRGKNQLAINLNGNAVPPWDPFCLDEPKTQRLSPFLLDVSQNGIDGTVQFEPYILPHQEDFSSPELFRRASGPANWNQQQGFYVYRAGRLIQSGGWSHLRTSDEHTKLARVAVRFSPKLDEAFKVNVAKMRVQMPASIRDELRASIVRIARLAREAYDRRAKIRPSVRPPIPPTPPSRLPIVTKEDWPLPPLTGPIDITQCPPAPPSIPVRLLTVTEWSDIALKVATPIERPFVESVISKLPFGE